MCIGCLQGCVSPSLKVALHCLLNPMVGYESETNLEKAQVSNSVLIVRGGPGGMEAARAAAVKGHGVELYEKNGFLGDQFKSAAYPPCKEDLASYTAWLIKEFGDLDVNVLKFLLFHTWHRTAVNRACPI